MKYITLLLAFSIAGLCSLSAGSKGTQGQTIDQFIAKQKEKSAEKGWKFKESKSREVFKEMDTNSDDLVTGPEKKAYYAKQEAAKKEAAKKATAE